MQLGPSHSPTTISVEIRRMASEDFARLRDDARSFLLIVCTERIVTRIARVPSDSPDVPAFSRMRTPRLRAAGASVELTLGPL